MPALSGGATDCVQLSLGAQVTARQMETNTNTSAVTDYVGRFLSHTSEWGRAPIYSLNLGFVGYVGTSTLTVGGAFAASL